MKKRGISLIVLIVTIIVIIILAAVVILTLSKNNPIESAKEAAFKEDVRTFQDELAMYISKDYTVKAGQRDDKISADKYTTDEALDSLYTYIPSFSKKYDGKLVIENDELVFLGDNKKEIEWAKSLDLKTKIPVPYEWTTYIGSMTYDGVPIPKGFTYLTGTKETGVVIEDGIHNEFVWIPSTVEEYKKDFNFPSNFSVISANISDPSIVANLDETLDIKKYGGFYIGRYEATTPEGVSAPSNTTGVPTCKSGKTVWTNIDYTNLKASAESMYTGDTSSVQSGLLTGKAWDRTCHWIEDYITTINTNASLRDSRYYGNNLNSLSPANVNGVGLKQVSGFSDKWSAKNIYDLAGNVWEWIDEAYNSTYRINRGGGYSGNGDNYPVSYRGYGNVSFTGNDIGFRVRLYIKTT